MLKSSFLHLTYTINFYIAMVVCQVYLTLNLGLMHKLQNCISTTITSSLRFLADLAYCDALYHLDFTFANSLTQIFKIFAQYFIHVTNANHCQSQASSVMLFAIIFTAMHTFPNKHVRMIRYSI